MGRTPLSKSMVNADTTVKYCQYCKRCWEKDKIRDTPGRKKKVNYYNDFPSIGKEKKACPMCGTQRHFCDLCDQEREDVIKQGVTWVCTDCDKSYPEYITPLSHPRNL